jgi:4-carboxymuconolactone decarboxylase
MAYTGSPSSRDLQRLRFWSAERSETPSEFEGFSGARIKLGAPGSSSRARALAMLGAPYARSTTMAPRIPPADESSLPDEIKRVLASLPPLNLFKVLANAPSSFKPFLELGGAILFKSELDARKREIAILRVAHITRSNYEWVQHMALAKHAGVTDEEIEKIASDELVTSLDTEGNLLCRVAEEITRDVKLSDDALAQIIERYGNRGATELIIACCWFNLISRFLESTRVELE